MLNGCVTAHQDFVKDMNNQIGYKVPLNTKPYKYENAGELYRADYLIVGQGFTHVTRDENNNIIRHWSGSEILNTYAKKDMVGKCLTYQIINYRTGMIIGWGFDEGGNPKSCVAWWP
jgi:hypothetical protein